jgi:hypothetical protein
MWRKIGVCRLFGLLGGSCLRWSCGRYNRDVVAVVHTVDSLLATEVEPMLEPFTVTLLQIKERLNDRIREHLATETVTMAIASTVTASWDDASTQPLDLTTKSARALGESVWLLHRQRQDCSIENAAGLPYQPMNKVRGRWGLSRAPTSGKLVGDCAACCWWEPNWDWCSLLPICPPCD